MPKRTYTSEEVESGVCASCGQPIDSAKEPNEWNWDDLLEALSYGESVRSFCKGPDPRKPREGWQGMERAIYRAMNAESQDALRLRQRYAHAKDAGTEARLDRARDVAANEPDVQRAKLVVDLDKWEASKRMAVKFGDRLTIENKIDDARAFEAFGAALADAGISEEQTQKVLDLTAQHLQALK